jgi:hypothetical protein
MTLFLFFSLNVFAQNHDKPTPNDSTLSTDLIALGGAGLIAANTMALQELSINLSAGLKHKGDVQLSNLQGKTAKPYKFYFTTAKNHYRDIFGVLESSKDASKAFREIPVKDATLKTIAKKLGIAAGKSTVLATLTTLSGVVLVGAVVDGAFLAYGVCHLGYTENEIASNRCEKLGSDIADKLLAIKETLNGDTEGGYSIVAEKSATHTSIYSKTRRTQTTNLGIASYQSTVGSTR